MNLAEFCLWALLGLLFWKRGLYRRFRAMASYLALHIVSAPMLLAAFYIQSQPWGRAYFSAYFYTYWLSYFAGAVLLFFVCIEVFRSALSALPGLMKFGVVIFRWAIVFSLVLTFSSISFTHRGLALIPSVASSLMRSISILELCLLVFLCLSMNALRLSIRDMAFGIALGFGMMASSDFLLALFSKSAASLTAPLQFAYESAILVALGIWTTYCLLPETARKPLMMPASSTIFRWNEIASALGHTGTQIAMPQQANSFFLTDVEKVVDKVLTRNLKGRESAS